MGVLRPVYNDERNNESLLKIKQNPSGGQWLFNPLWRSVLFLFFTIFAFKKSYFEVLIKFETNVIQFVTHSLFVNKIFS